MLLNERSREIFRLIVESYLATGEPVGSRNLSRILPMTLSPASVRNVMSDLEQLGLVYAPHTSAGRLPTEIGLRFLSTPDGTSAISPSMIARRSKLRSGPGPVEVGRSRPDSEQLTSVAYVRNAMTSDGKIWRADLDKIVALLQTVALNVSASGLESEPRKEPK